MNRTANNVKFAKGISFIWVFVVAIVSLSGLCGCTYQAQLYNDKPFEPGTEVAVVCKINEKPIVEISETGDFIFWAAGGPGPIAAGAAYIVNESNNRQHGQKLKSVINRNSYSDQLTVELTKVLEESGLQVKDVKKGYKGIGDIVTFALSGIGLGSSANKQDVEYVLALNIKYGLFDSEAQCGAQIEGQLINTEDSKVVWKNKLSFEGRTGGKHRGFGDGKQAVNKWQENLAELEAGLDEAVRGVCGLLEREFADRTAEDVKPLEKLKLKPGGRVKAKIIEHSPERIVLRLKGGSVRSIPAEELVAEEEQVALSK